MEVQRAELLSESVNEASSPCPWMILDIKLTRSDLFRVGFITHGSTVWVANSSNENYNTRIGLYARKASHT